MRIAYLLTTAGMGGAERQAISLAERMAVRGHEVRIFAMRSAAAEQWTASLPVQHLGIEKNPIAALVGALRGVRALRAFGPELVHAHCFHANMFGRIARLYLPSSHAISTVHNVYEGGRARMMAYRITDHLATRNLFVSVRAAQRYVEQQAASSCKSFVLHNGIDTDAFTPNAQRRREMRSA